MKAEDYITQWCDETYGSGKELGDWTTKEVMKFANDLASKNKSKPSKLHKCHCEISSPLHIKMCTDCNGIVH